MLEQKKTTSYAGGIKTALALDKKKSLCRTECGFANHILRTGRFIFEMKDNKDVDSLSLYDMEMSISCGVCTEISEDDDLRPDQKGYRHCLLYTSDAADE